MHDLLHTLAAVALLALAAIGGGLGRRIDGGLLASWLGRDMGKAIPRTLSALGVALPLLGALALTGGPLWVAPLAAVGLWIGSTMGLHGAENMGRNTANPAHPILPNEWRRDAWGAAAYGVGSICAASLALYPAVGWSNQLATLAGLLCVACYELAWRHPLHIPWLRCFRTDPPPTGELLFGAVRGLAIVGLVLGVR